MRKIIPVNQLMPGMTIVGLDIGWHKSPKWQSPFVLNSGDDLALLLRHCRHVEIADPSSSRKESLKANSKSLPGASQPKRSTSAAKIPPGQASLPPQTAENKQSAAALSLPVKRPTSLKQKVPQRFVVKSFHDCLDLLDQCFGQLSAGNTLDLNLLKNVQKRLLLSAMAHPDTLSLLSQLEEKSDTLARKSLDVTILSLVFARSMAMPQDRIQRLCLSAMLHDIGMLKLPAKLLQQRHIASAGQQLLLQKHVNYSCRMLQQVPELKPLVPIVACHHERFDGKGYPRGLKGQKIPLESRIIGITMSYEAMTRHRHFSNRETPTQALRKLYRERNNAFDGHLVERFIQSLGVYPLGTLVELNGRRIGIVSEINQTARARPKVRLLSDAGETTAHARQEVDLSRNPHIRITRIVGPEEISGLQLQILADELGFGRAA